MKLFIDSRILWCRQRISFGIIISFTLASVAAGPRTLGQVASQTQTLAVNRALVSTGPPAVPPTKATSSLALGGLGQVIATLNLGPLPAIKLSSNQGIFDLVGVSPDQLVQVTVAYPALAVGRLITAEALDGGQIIGTTALVVGPDQAIHFQFRAAHTPGFNHIALHDRSREVGLQFWVLDAQHPERRPAIINP